MYMSKGNSTRRGERTPIRFRSYSIRNGQNSGLESDLRGMSQTNLDLGVIQESKITDGIYTRRSDGYSIFTTDGPTRHRSGVAVFYRESLRFTVEAIQKFGPKVVRFQMMTGERQWYIIGCYFPPENAFENREQRRSAQRAPPGIQTAGGRRFQSRPGET